jgi:flagella basal body P-ring formation protein FlgA
VQAFELTLRTGSGVEQLAVDARVTLPPPVVVAARSLARGTVIAPGDVRLQRPAATGGSPVQQSIGYRRATSGKADDAFHSLEDVLGMEAARSISAGSALEPKMVRRPVLVERGELVTVVARSGGIRVRTTARAKEDASLGDLVAVESLESRKEYFARVCGPQEVEVYARPSGAERIAAAEGW